MQKYTSAETSINSSQLPKIYRLAKDEIKGKAVIDYGCGKFFDSYVGKVDAELHGYDPYHRPDKAVLGKHFDVALCSNVLNVIAEEEERRNVLESLRELADESLITVYEGDGSGIGRETKKDCYQLNRKTGDYKQELDNVFDDTKLKGKVWFCK